MSKTPPPKSLGTVLVLGGCGFLGGHVVDQLLNFPSEDNSPDLSFSANTRLKHIHSTTSLPDPTTLTFPSLRSRYPSYTNTTVHVIDLKCSRNTYPGATYHEADITSPESLLSVFRTVKPTVIINTASPYHFSPKSILHKVNVDGTRTLLEVAAGVHGSWGGTLKAFVHTSSASVIHDAVSDLINADETYPLMIPNPIEYYSETKAIGEKLVLDANRNPTYNNLLTCAIRPAGIVGEKDYGGFTNGVLTTASISPAWQLHFQLGDGNNLFDNTYVGNVVYAHLLAAEALIHTYDRGSKTVPLNHEKIDGEAFIVTNDSPAYFWDTCRFIWTRYGRTVDLAKIWVLPEAMANFAGGAAEITAWLTGRKGKMTRQSVKYACMYRYYSCDKLKSRLRYQPVVEMDEALERSVRSFKIEELAEKAAQDGKKAQ